MSYLGKQSILFFAAAILGGGVAFMIGHNSHQAHSPIAEATPNKAKPTLRSGNMEESRSSDSRSEPSAAQRSSISLAKAPGAATSAQSASSSASTAPGDEETMLSLLRALRSSPSMDTSSPEEKSRHTLKEALEKLLNHLRQSELARSVVSRRDTEGYISTFVVIAPPTANEINTLKQMLVELHEGLPPEHLVRFQNESLQLVRQFVFDQDKSLVVFLTEQFDRSPAKMGNFHSHLTQRPNEFWHHHNGEPLGKPPGATTLEGGVISNPVSPNFRFYHLASQR